MSRRIHFVFLIAAVVLVRTSGAQTSVASGGPAPAKTSSATATQIGTALDPVAATNAYLATIPADKRAKSNAYFEGGYWINFWDMLITAAVMLLILHLGISRRLRGRAEHVTTKPWIHTWVYYAALTILVGVVTFPWEAYTGFFRERHYDLMNQSFGAWFKDQLKGIVVSLILGGLTVMALYGVVRKLPKSWPVWGSIVATVFLVFSVLISPIYINPLFNKYTLLTDARVRDPILQIARANDIHADKVYVVDASKQSKRISANVSGIFGTERITLNDNLLNRTSLPEIKAVMGHEMGHYVLNHVYEFILEYFILIVATFALLKLMFNWAVTRWGMKWGVRDVGDVAGMPLVVLIASIWFFLLTPVTNTMIRTNEAEADAFGLNAAREPDGFAQVSLKLSEYRKLEPSAWEERIFFDHPSGRTRIYKAMVWKAAQAPPRSE